MTLGRLLVAILIELGLYVGALERGETVDWYVCIVCHAVILSINIENEVALWLSCESTGIGLCIRQCHSETFYLGRVDFFVWRDQDVRIRIEDSAADRVWCMCVPQEIFGNMI